MPGPGIRFRVPPQRRALVERARLVRRLPTEPDRMPRLVLLAAPAGFGKTTLLTQWLTALSHAPVSPAVAWLSVEPADRDVRRFLTGLVASVDHATGGGVPQASAHSQGERQAPPEEVLAHLVTELDELATPLVIALDDVHVAASPEVHAALAFLAEHLPARTTVAMTTRADPALPLARMRARGELLELRAVDLRFTPPEAGAFLTDVMDLELADDQVAAIAARTEGWPAGLQLAALSALARVEDADAVELFIRDFSGSNRFVLDYLLDEVLAAEDDATRAYLLRTSVLEVLSGPLCDALTGRQDSQAMLERLERRNLFVMPLDDGRRWYRYHHLFADALRARLLAESPEEFRELHRTASRWYARHGSIGDAVLHARESGDDGLTAYLVETAIPALRRQRRDQTIIDWVTPLPEAVVRASPLLATTRAWARLASGEVDKVDGWLTIAERPSQPGSPEQQLDLPPDITADRDHEVRLVPGTVAIYRASLAQASGDVAATVEHATRARDLAQPGDHLLLASAAGFLGLADWVEGDLAQAKARFEETRVHLEAVGDLADALGTSVPVAAMTVGLGRPDLARRLLEEDLATAKAHEGPTLASHADLHVTLADVLREAGDVEGARHHLDAARGLGDVASLPENRFRLYAVSADLLASTGDLEGALAMLDRAERLHLPGFLPDIAPLPARRARILVRFGRIDEARAWAAERGSVVDGSTEYRSEYARLTLARLLLAEGGPGLEASLVMLDRIVTAAEAAGRFGRFIDALVVRALTHRALGAPAAGVNDLARALVVGVPAGYRRVYLDEGEAMDGLLRDLLDQPGAAAAHAAARGLLTDSRPATQARHPSTLGTDELTLRELDVLRLLDSDLTGPEVAAHLFVSINTLRTHTRRIFTKLDVTTRRAAVSRARERGLL
ncbi:AAA family ATPase [Nostocoides sp. F2B08]|uniref:LuxR C-terminal-related transcriptional regulator n=1 Tax=Nostocoides sp. F2B08 TaxID=2653936 RepID=UPI001263AE2F|nr:LuxR C-terminal-related transcriptional regulator [Tetrasphaera sp. F2B08]KAB7744196.1 AAA family ATPase [Tetrasphaera sp. F2B08]